jgi:hypothetical protein
MSSCVLERLKSFAVVTSHLRLGIMVLHYKFIILGEVLASHASDDRPMPRSAVDLYMRPVHRPALGGPRDFWGLVG